MGLRISAFVERVRSSLFFVPMLFVIAGGAAAYGMLELDTAVGEGATDLPFVLMSTVEGAREILGVVASATITVAGIAFSVSLLVIQQASSQFSPRVVHSLFRDPFNRRVMGLSVGTFTYCLIVLRAVRGSLDDGIEPVIPNLAVGMSVILGVVSILGIVAFIDHNAHTLDVSQILSNVTAETAGQIERTWAEPGEGERGGDADALLPPGPGHTIVFARRGWLQQLSSERLFELVPAGGTVRLETAVGRYAVKGTPLCTVWPAPSDPAVAKEQADDAVQLGPARTMQQDPSYGLRQLADVALIALSPGVNDPTTAQEAIFHLAAVLREALVRDPPPRVEHDDEGRRLLRPEDHSHETLVELAFDEIRRMATDMPTVCIYMFEALRLLEEAVKDAGLSHRASPVRAQADQVLAGAERAELLPGDLRLVRAAYQRRFGGTTSST